jgi:hypothetical protein
MYQTNSTETLRAAASEEEKVEVERRMRERRPEEGVAVLESLEESSWLQILWSTGPVS